jgi:hypothetical protein
VALCIATAGKRKSEREVHYVFLETALRVVVIEGTPPTKMAQVYHLFSEFASCGTAFHLE